MGWGGWVRWKTGHFFLQYKECLWLQTNSCMEYTKTETCAHYTNKIRGAGIEKWENIKKGIFKANKQL